MIQEPLIGPEMAKKKKSSSSRKIARRWKEEPYALMDMVFCGPKPPQTAAPCSALPRAKCLDKRILHTPKK